MNKEELIAWLRKQPGNPKVILASDAEGNSFSELDEPAEGLIPKDYTGGRTEEVFQPQDIVDEADPDESVLEDFDTVVVLWPV